MPFTHEAVVELAHLALVDEINREKKIPRGAPLRTKEPEDFLRDRPQRSGYPAKDLDRHQALGFPGYLRDDPHDTAGSQGVSPAFSSGVTFLA